MNPIPTRLLLRDKYKVVHSDRLYRPVLQLKVYQCVSMHFVYRRHSRLLALYVWILLNDNTYETPPSVSAIKLINAMKNHAIVENM